MKNVFVSIVLTLFTASVLLAADGDAKAEVKAAAKKLGEKPNYSWTSTPKVEGGGGGGNFRLGPTDGKIEKDGITYLKMSFGDRTIFAASKGDKVAVKSEDVWEAGDDLEGNGQFMVRRMKTFKAPAAEAADLAEKAKALKKADGVISGDLTEDSVKELLTFRRPNADSSRPAPKDAKGSVKFWVKDGELTKYEFQVQGKVTGRDDQEMEVNRTTTVEIKDAGKTKLTLPEEARKKLS